ncbi:MAG TPA: oligoendopeptidase F [Sedimentisphaerales bacterium]|jgi:oligoendopeptidase F|nr:oligoendopeptidase F [Sedimentisphaerales bacterium]HNU30660.1 oligoendopeptidase F [Sedimentisphaerales bacterium]
MKRLGLLGGLMMTMVISLSARGGWGQTLQRAEIPAAHQWKLEDLYPSDEAWRQAKTDLAGRLDEVLEYRGKLTGSPVQLLACLTLNSEMAKTFGRLNSYAHMKSDQDTRNATYLAMKQEIEQLATEYSTRASFIEPELVALDAGTIERFIVAESGLKVYRMYLLDVLRGKPHTLSQQEEKILARAGQIADGPGSTYTVFSNAEMPYPEITLSDGTVATLNKSGYALHRASTNRQDREAVFQAFWSAMNQFRQTFGVQLYSHLQTHIFYARSRNYESCLHLALDRNNIPVEVYHSLIRNVRSNLDTFHRYLRLRRRMLGVEVLKYSDLYAPVVKGIDLKYTFDQGRDLYLDCLGPLGEDYRKAAQAAFSQRWIDVYPAPGKRSGAYSNGSVYDVHPYILLNFNGQYDDVSTLAHEMGHALHSYYSNKSQPFPLANYATFVAEVASTFNETLLIHKMLREIENDEVRLSLLMTHLDEIRGTVFRQTQFAEFELRMHEAAERGEPLTGDAFTKLYARIVRDYYGHDQGVCLVDDLYTVEWAYIPHFYYNFYVYQYSTSFTAATALAEETLSGSEDAARRYLRLISAGGSDYPIAILKEAGVDMTTPEPFQKTMAVMNRTMDQIEEILARRK